MRKIIFIISLALSACQSGPPNHIPADEFRITFDSDSRNGIESFVPSKKELGKLEIALKKHLEALTEKDQGLKRKVLNEVHPLEYSLGWFKRRYFGRIDKNRKRQIFVELIFVRCGGSGDWKNIDFPSESNSECWWSVEYSVDDNLIENINFPKSRM